MIVLLAAALVFSPDLGPPEGMTGMEDGMEGEIRMTILFDNFSDDPGFTTGWGFSALLETRDHTLLFDTGADGGILLENMRLLGKDPLDIDVVVISHAHADHTGGLQALLDLGIRPTFYLLSAFPDQLKEGLAPRGEVMEAVAGQEIIPGVFTTGMVGSTIPEQALILKTAEGLIVLTGCAHPGIVEMAERTRDLFPDPLRAVLGGFHLMQAPEERILSVINDLQAMGIQEAGPTHCSGETAMNLFSEAFGEGYLTMGVGKVLTLRTVGPW